MTMDSTAVFFRLEPIEGETEVICSSVSSRLKSYFASSDWMSASCCSLVSSFEPVRMMAVFASAPDCVVEET